MKKKVMVVDDEQEIVDFLGRFLDRLNVSVIKAIRSIEVIDYYHQFKPDCVFLDIQMPDKDGMTLLKELRKLDSDSKVIMITGRGEKEFQERAKRMGAVDYITKPLDLNDLREKIEKYIL